MKIVYDYQAFTFQKYGGISRYFYEIMKGIKKEKDYEVEIGVNYTENGYLGEIPHLGNYKAIQLGDFRGKVRLLNAINQYSTLRSLKEPYDIFHPTYYETYFLKRIGANPFVLTVHDMIHEKFPELFPERDLTAQNKALLVEKATKIIAISESTKKDLIDILNVPEEKIEVIYHANSLVMPNEESEIVKKLPKRYVLFVGVRNGYKNFNNFIKAMTDLIHKDGELYVCCVGGGKFNEEEKALLEELKIQERIVQIGVYDSDLTQVYRKALAFVFPSWYEGFGIPLLEAMYSGCPVITSNVSSLPEVAGEAAVYFDPYSEKEIQKSIEQVIYNEDLRKELIQKGYKRNAQFSWNITVQKTRDVYRSLKPKQH